MSANLKKKIKEKGFNFVLKLLKNTSKSLIQEKSPTIVGVTGSVGKSSFTHLLDSVMKDVKKTKTTFKGNSETGIPLEILGIRSCLKNYSLLNWLVVLVVTPFAYLIGKLKFDYELFIAEMGIDSPKEPKNMSYLLDIIKPDIGVFLAVSAAHTQQFAEESELKDEESIVKAIAKEKGKIVTELDSNSHAVINIDYPLIKELIPNIKANIITFGMSSEAEYSLVGYTASTSSTKYSFIFNSKQYDLEIKGYLLSKEYVTTILAVIATAVTLGEDIQSVISKIEERFNIPNGRMSLIEGKNGSTILDSSYNSSPLALKSTINSLRDLKAEGKKTLVLGDMRELGPLAESEHRELADIVAETADRVVLVGPLMKKYLLPELQKRDIPVDTFLSSLGVGEFLINSGYVNNGDIILVKGSQNEIFLEQVVLELMEKPEEAKNLLCRQSTYWEKMRRKFFEKVNA
jgi:UDP-N-acetylmuramoyl-tripeptide--D-alanyl-D-alanine ligase